MKIKKNVKEVKMHKFLVCAYKSPDFAQIQKKKSGSYDRVTVTFRWDDGMMSSTTAATSYQGSAKALPGGELYFFEIQKKVILEYTLNNILSIFGVKNTVDRVNLFWY